MEKKLKISVIGGSGFVGTSLCQALADRQIDFEIIDLKLSKRFLKKSKIADVRNIKSLETAITGDLIVNLAAVHTDNLQDKSEYARTNVYGAENIVKICNLKGIKKIVFTSSVAVYGFAAPETGENGKINPFNEYGETKYQAEEVLRAWQTNGDNELIIVRPTVIFGEGNRGNVFNLLNQIASGRFLMVGSGKNRKSMAYIDNVTAFLMKCIEAKKNYALYNYVDTPDLDMNTLVRRVRRVLRGNDDVGLRLPFWLILPLGYMVDAISWVTQKTFPISAIRIQKFCSTTSFLSAKSTLDGFEPPYSLLEGIDRTLQSEFVEPNPQREIFYTE